MFYETWVGRGLFGLTFLALSVGQSAQAISIVLADFDNTTVETRESADGTFETPFVIFRIDQRATTLQPVATGPKEVFLSPIEYHRNRQYLGRGPGVPGAIGRSIKLKNGTTINPGHYYVRNPDSFRFFFSDEKRNHPLEDLKTAMTQDPKGKWKGPYYTQMQQILSRKETAATFGLITARGHSKSDWQGFFNHLKAKGEIKHLPNFDLFHNVSLSDYDQYSLSWNTSAQKVGVLKEIALHLGRTAVTEDRLSPDGKEYGAYHFIVFVDDNQETIELAVQTLGQLAQNKTVPIKFGIYNMGNRTEITESRRPKFAILKSDGTFRHATAEETVGEPIQIVNVANTEEVSCPEQLSGDEDPKKK